ncbi:PTS transporter subunit EIIC [Paenibacillus sp. URB8-2]|uniref:PTS transporter subunit EIIC n=1 Tax=Paenibacillus sp. URB8-2 TaxID=2741301 RepID=UPI0015BABBFE|nr:PTS transporter subunit EIIC [Paenibacillus sp. URB8-2]BCG59786.1 negative regulator of SacY activity [Paenibacillus sp. URB8-2]
MPEGNIQPIQNGRSVKDNLSPAKELAMRLIELSGGTDNVSEVAHCTTRIRIRFRDSARVDEAGLAQLEEVQNVFIQSGQLQIIVGPAIVFKVHRQMVRLLQDSGPEPQREAERLYVPSEPENLVSVAGSGDTLLPSLRGAWKRRVLAHLARAESAPELKDSTKRNLIGRVMRAATFFSDIVVPIIPLFVALGLLLGLISMIQAFGWASQGSTWFRTLLLLTGSAFQIMAVMFGYHAAKRFGGTPALGAAVGIVMTRLDLLQLSGTGGAAIHPVDLTSTPQFGYQGTVIPIILAVLLMTFIEKGLRRIIPSSATILLVPFLSFVVGGGLAVLVIGPLAAQFGSFLSGLLEEVFRCGSMVFGLLLGGVYGLIVLTGLHHGIQAIEIGLISNPNIGVNFLLPIWSMANIAQGGAGLAVYARTRDKDLKKIAFPASITAFLGITEPIAFGVNLKLGRPFVGAAVGGAAGGAYVAFHGVVANSFGLTGIPMIAFIVPPGHINFIHYMVGLLLATGTAFAVTWFLGVDKPHHQEE